MTTLLTVWQKLKRVPNACGMGICGEYMGEYLRIGINGGDISVKNPGTFADCPQLP